MRPRLATFLAVFACLIPGSAFAQAGRGRDPLSDPRLADPSGAVPSSGNQELDQIYRDLTLREREQRALAEHYYEVGRTFYDTFQYREAERNFRRAVDLWSGHPEAQHYLIMSGWLLNKREPTIRATSELIWGEKQVTIQQKKMEVIRLYAEAMRLKDAEEYTQAIRKFEMVLETIKWFPYQIDDQNLAEKAQRNIDQCKELRLRQELSHRAALERGAHLAALAEERSRQQAERRKIDILLERVTEYLRLHRYRKAEEGALQILELDPRNAYASKLHKVAVEGRHAYRQLETFRDTRENILLDSEMAEEVGIPYAEWFRFPDKDKWDQVTQRQFGVSDAAHDDPQQVKELRATLETLPVSLSFDDKVSLRDIVSFLQDITGLNIRIAPEVDADGIELSLRLNQMKLGNALDILMDQTSLTYSITENFITIHEPGAVQKELIFEIYPVRDILNKVQDFPSPPISISTPDQPAAGGSGGGAGGLQLDFGLGGEEDSGSAIDAEKLIDIMEQALGDDATRDGEMEVHKGLLLVWNSREVHRQIRKILEHLRKNQDLFVVIEARFLEVFDDQLREFGFDYRGLGSVQTLRSRKFPNKALPTKGSMLGGVSPGTQRLAGTPANNVQTRLQNTFDGFGGFLEGDRLIGGSGLTVQSTWVEPYQLNAIMRAEELESKIRLLTAPVVTAHNRQRVHVAVLTQRAYIADYELGSGGNAFSAAEIPDPVIQTFQEGVILDVRPTISSDLRYVTLDVRPSLAALVGGDISTILVNLGTQSQAATQVPIGVPEILLEQVYTTVTIPDGGTAMLGGFRGLTEKKYRSSIPWLSSIPILNTFFRRLGNITERRSLVILVTARIVNLREEERSRFSTGE